MTMFKLGEKVRAPGRVRRACRPYNHVEWVRPSLARPLEGVYVGSRHYQNGKIWFGDEAGCHFEQKGTVKIALIAIHDRRNPVPVLYSETEKIDG